MPPSVPPRTQRHSDGMQTIGECAPVAALQKRARMLDALNQRLRQLLPPALRDQCCLADVRAGRLVFLANSSTWAAKLRLYQTTLLAEARSALGPTVEKFAIKVASLSPAPRSPTNSKPLSKAAANHLVTAAHSLTDPELRDLFLQLASLAKVSS